MEAEPGTGGGDENGGSAGRGKDGTIPGLLDPPVRLSVSSSVVSVDLLLSPSKMNIVHVI